MFKKLLVILALFLMTIGNCYGAGLQVNTVNQAEAISNMYDDLLYLYKGPGLSYKKFDDKYTEATIAKNRFLTKNKELPPSLVEAFENVDMAFADGKRIWDLSFQYGSLYKSNYTESLMKKYPRMSVVKRKGIAGVYYIQELGNVIVSYCDEYNTKLKSEIQNLK